MAFTVPPVAGLNAAHRAGTSLPDAQMMFSCATGACACAPAAVVSPPFAGACPAVQPANAKNTNKPRIIARRFIDSSQVQESGGRCQESDAFDP